MALDITMASEGSTGYSQQAIPYYLCVSNSTSPHSALSASFSVPFLHHILPSHKGAHSSMSYGSGRPLGVLHLPTPHQQWHLLFKVKMIEFLSNPKILKKINPWPKFNTEQKSYNSAF